MEAYIKHLLSDINAAARPPETGSQYLYPEWIEEQTNEEERWPETEPVHTFGYYCGLQPEQFPPAHLLTSLQLDRICQAFSKMMFTWNLDTDIPDQVPPGKKYQLLISTLSMKTDISNNNLMTFELCSVDPPSCPLGEYCVCKEFLEDEPMENIDDYLYGE